MTDDKPLFDAESMGSLSNLVGNLMGQVQQMQANMKQIREDLRAQTVEGESGGGIVRVTANGASEVLRVTVDPVAVDPRDVSMLEDLVAAATNDALSQANGIPGRQPASYQSHR